METILETTTKNFVIVFDKEKNVYSATLAGMIEIDEYKKCFTYFLDNYPYSQVPDVMFDTVFLNNSPAAGRAWFGSFVIPEFKRRLVDETKLRKMAVAQPKSLFQNTVIKILFKTMRQMGYKFNVEFFSTKDEALAWLAKK